MRSEMESGSLCGSYLADEKIRRTARRYTSLGAAALVVCILVPSGADVASKRHPGFGVVRPLVCNAEGDVGAGVERKRRGGLSGLMS